MASEWREIRLGDVVQMKSGGTPRKAESSYWNGSIPWLSAKDMKTFLVHDTEDHVSELGAANGTRSMPAGATYLLVRGMTLLNDIPIVVGKKPMTFNQDVKGLLPKSGVVGAYVPYLLLGMKPALRDLVDLAGHGTGRLNTDRLQDLPCVLPYEDEQHRIVALLSALDDRIDHNRALAANLEAIASALFQTWFVDFDPVRAKAVGETPPGLAPDLAALFPDRFADSELGEIPKGWDVVPLSRLVEVERGLSYKGAGLANRETGKPMHNLNSVLEGGGYKYAGIKFYSGDHRARHIARAGDVVVANTEQGHKHLLIGFPAIIPATYDEGLFSHHLYRVRLLQEAKATKHWLYYALKASVVRDQIIGHANGSTVNMLKPSGLQAPLVILPPMEICHQFECFARALHARIEACVAEAAALSEMRDLLLPRLISGRLRVEDAEQTLEAA